MHPKLLAIFSSAFLSFLHFHPSLLAAPADTGYWDSHFVQFGRLGMNFSADDSGRLIASSLNGIQRWDGVAFETLGPIAGNTGPAVLARGEVVVAGGTFTTYNNVSANNIAIRQNGSWSQLGDGFNNGVRDIKFWSEAIIAGGAFTASGATPISSIARWTGAQWEQLGAGLPGTVVELEPAGDQLFAVYIDAATFAHVIMRWNQSDWTEIGRVPRTQTGPGVRDLLWDDGTLYAVGRFDSISDTPVVNLAVYRDGVWRQLGNAGFTGTAMSVVKAQGKLFISGAFSVVFQAVVTRFPVAIFTGDQWSAELLGIARDGTELAAVGDEVFLPAVLVANVQTPVVYRFNHLGWTTPFRPGVGPGRLAQNADGVVFSNRNGTAFPLFWDGQILRDTQGGSSSGSELFSYKGEVYREAGPYYFVLRGNRWEASSIPSIGLPHSLPAENGDELAIAVRDAGYSVYIWNGSIWRNIATFDADVRAVAWFKGELYAAGMFISAPNAVPASHVARWNGTSWSALASGLDGNVTSLAATPDKLYVGGFFQKADGVSSRNLAAWNGASWEQFDVNPNGPIYRLASSKSGALAVTGSFRYFAGLDAGGLVILQNGRWNILGASNRNFGLSDTELLWRGNNLFVLGPNIAGFWHQPGLQLEQDTRTPGLLKISATGAAPRQFKIQSSPDLSNWTDELPNNLGNTRPWIFPTTERAKLLRARE